MKICSYVFIRHLSIWAAAALACLYFGTARTATAQRLPATVVPSHYALAFTPDLKNATFTGVESIDVNIAQPTQTITLNAIELAFQSVEIDSGGQQQSGAVSLDPGQELATFTFPAILPAGNATIRIHYTGILNHELRGFYLSKTARRNYAVTQFEATDARRAFPCFDEPALKAKFDISLTIDSGDMAISNSPVVSDTPGPVDGKHTVVFDTTPKMSTYLVAFLVGDFQCVSGQSDGVDLRVCATPDKVGLTSFALDLAKFTLHYYDDYFGIHFPLKKLDFIGVPDFEAGAMENFGAITFRETDLLVDPKTASVRTKSNAALAITHEMAHQWFGDLVTMQWWNNVWLNEGFATWMESKPVAAMHPEWNIPQMVASDLQATLNVDAQPTTRTIRANADTPAEINEMFDSIAYGKAGHVLSMVENYLGPETFRKGVHAYLAAHEYGNATAEDFWNAQTETSHKRVDTIMQSLVVQPGVPLLKFGTPAEGTVPVAQSRFFLSPSVTPDPEQTWTLPVCFKTGSDSQHCELVNPDSRSLQIPSSSLLFANAGGSGYFRSAYAPAQYQAILDHAESSLTSTERISLVGDEWAQVRANKATVGDYLTLVAALKTDSDPEVLSMAFNDLGTIDSQVASTRKERDVVDRWIQKNFGPVYATLATPSPSDSPGTKRLQAELFSLLGHHGEDRAIIAQAREIADRYLADPASVDPNLAQSALGIAAENGDSAFFEKLQHVYETSSNPAIQEGALYLLTQFKDPTLLGRALDYAISSKVRNQDAALLLAIGLQVDENRDQTWQFVKAHWEQVHAQLTPDTGERLVRYTGSFCSAEAHDDVEKFFAEHKVPAAKVALHHSLEHIDECVEFRRLQSPNLKSWMAAQPGM